VISNSTANRVTINHQTNLCGIAYTAFTNGLWLLNQQNRHYADVSSVAAINKFPLQSGSMATSTLEILLHLLLNGHTLNLL